MRDAVLSRYSLAGVFGTDGTYQQDNPKKVWVCCNTVHGTLAIQGLPQHLAL